MRQITFHVGPREAGQDLANWLKARLRLPWPDLRRLVQKGNVHVNGLVCVDPSRRLRRGQRVDIRPAKKQREGRSAAASPRRKTGGGLDPASIRYLDKHIVVLDKPAGLTTMRHPDEAAEFGSRGKRFLPPTAADLLPELIAAREAGPPRPLRAVHRLDKETSGLVVFARNVEAERALGDQFRAHTVERLYRAVVRGRAADAIIASDLVRDRGDGRRGSGAAGDGQRAVTHVRVVERLGAYSVVECRLETGRTHQVRIHLGEAGTPICGDHVYDRPLHGQPIPDGSGMKRVALHAAVLGLDHPHTGKRMRWTARLPRDMRQLVERLRDRMRELR